MRSLQNEGIFDEKKGDKMHAEEGEENQKQIDRLMTDNV